MRTRVSITLLMLSLGLYVASLFSDGFYIQTAHARDATIGWALLQFGWLSLFYGIFAWLANPLFIAGWMMLVLHQKRVAAIFAVTALACSSSFLLCQTVITQEAGSPELIDGYGLGYWLWLASPAVLVAASLVAAKTSHLQTPTTGTQLPNANPLI